MPQIKAKLPDGRTLVFPEGTSMDIVQKTVRQQLGLKTAETTVQTKDIGPSSFKGQEVKKDWLHDRRPINPFNMGNISEESGAFDKPTLEQGLSILGGLIGGAGGKVLGLSSKLAALLSSFSAAAGSTGAEVYEGKNPTIPLLGEINTGNKGLDVLASVGAKTGVNELVGRGINSLSQRMQSAWNELEQPGRMLGGKRNLDLTFSQYTDSEAAKLIEDYTVRTRKETAIEASMTRAAEKADDITTKLGGKKGTFSREGLQSASEEMRLKNKEAFTKILSASNREAENAKLQAAQVVVPNMKNAIGPMTKQNSIEGPIAPINTANKIRAFLNDQAKVLGKPDPDDKFIKDISSILDEIQNPDGSLNPVSFERAWASKSNFGTKAYGDPLQATNFADSRYKQLYSAIDKDIRASLPQWNQLKPGVGTKALQHYDAATALANKRHSIWNLSGEVGGSAKTLLNTMDDPNPQVDAIFKDFKKLNRFLETGDLQVAGITVNKNNLTPAAKSYWFSKLFHDAWDATSPTDIQNGKINAEALTKGFNEYFNSAQGKRLYNAQDRKLIGDFIQDIGKIDQLSNKSRYLELKFISSGVALLGTVGTALATGSAGAAGIAGATAGAGVYLTARQLGKLLVNKQSAPIIAAMSKTYAKQIPLGMSEQAAARIFAQVLRGEKVQTVDGQELEIK